MNQRPQFSGISVFSEKVVEPFQRDWVRLQITERPSNWRDEVVRRLNVLCALPLGWDGYGAGPVSFQNAHFALRVLDSVCGVDAPAPSVIPGVSGDLQLEWHAIDSDVELHIRSPYDVHAWRETEETGDDGEELFLTSDFTAISAWVSALGAKRRVTDTAAA